MRSHSLVLYANAEKTHERGEGAEQLGPLEQEVARIVTEAKHHSSTHVTGQRSCRNQIVPE
jgi:hypothetical protein